MIRIYDNFLPIWLHERVKEQLLNPYFNWHFPGYLDAPGDINKASFSNIPYVVNKTENFEGCDAVRYALDCWLYENRNFFQIDYLSRCLINLYTAGQNSGWHRDIVDEDNVYSLIYYVNESDGGTEFETGERVDQKENRFVFFKSTELHSPISSTVPRRVNINWIMKGRIKE